MGTEPTSHPTDPELPTRTVWDRLSPVECEAIARELARALPPPWAFRAVRHQSMGDQARHVAFLDYEGDEFALIPGGPAVLGYDRNTPPSLSQEWCREYGELCELPPEQVLGKLLTYFDSCMAPLRTVAIAPLLLETV